MRKKEICKRAMDMDNGMGPRYTTIHTNRPSSRRALWNRFPQQSCRNQTLKDLPRCEID
jgi:hypothetical protein